MPFALADADHTASQTHDEHVVLQLLEEIHQLIRPNPTGAPPSALRLKAAAKLYLDTRDTFEAIERSVEGPTPADRPKFLRKLSKRRGINQTPRQSLVMSQEDCTSPPATARNSVEAAVAKDTNSLSSPISARSTDSRRSSLVLNPDADRLPVNEATVDRIQDLFRHLGELLSRPLLDEVRHRNLTIQATLHYVRFLPQLSQWAAYVAKREEETRMAFQPLQHHANETILHELKRNAEFVKEQIRQDVNTVCLFAPDGTLSTIFGDDVTTDLNAVAEKFDGLIRDVYAQYLVSVVDATMDRITRMSDQWAHDVGPPVVPDTPHAQLYTRARKFRAKVPIFPHTITALDDHSAVLPPTSPGQQARILVADASQVGLWWLKSILAATDRDITTVHIDETRGMDGVNASLDGQTFVPLLYDSPVEFLRRYARQGGLAKFQGHRLLVNNNRDSLWVEVTVLETEEKRCKLQLKKALASHPETATWRKLLAANEWIQVKDLRLCLVPLNPSFRIHMGVQFRTTVNIMQALVTEISSIFPNEELERRVATALWQAVEPAVSRGEHIYARYFRSILNVEWQPRRPMNHNHLSDRSSSIVLSTASVRNLVAALEHSSNSIGAMSIDSRPQPRAPPQRRLSIGSSAATATRLGTAVEVAFFDDKGVYHHQTVARDVPLVPGMSPASSPFSPFERLSHQLLEEMDVMGACIQHRNVALARAFAHVLQDKLTRLATQTQTKLANDDTSSLEVVVAEYANAARFSHTWRIVRYQLNTVAKQQHSRVKGSGSLHAEWVNRSFHRMEALVSTILQLQLQHVQRVFFHECVSVVAAGVGEQHWTSPKPWFSNSRCTPALQFVVFRLQQVMDETMLRVLRQYERGLGVHEKLHELAAWLLVDLVGCVGALYESLVVSRARTNQWKMDVVYFVAGVHKLLRLLEKMLDGKTMVSHADPRSHTGSKTPTTKVRERCLRLLTCVALRCGPADVVVDELTTRAELASVLPQGGDPVTELEVHLTALRTTLGLQRQPTSSLTSDDLEDSSLWTSHSVFGGMDLHLLADANLSWASLISRSSVDLQSMLASLTLRHELGDWVFPPLTEEQTKHRTRLQACVDRLQDRIHNDHAMAEQAASTADGMQRGSQPSLQLTGSFKRSATNPASLPNHPFSDRAEPQTAIPKPSVTEHDTLATVSSLRLATPEVKAASLAMERKEE